MQLEVRNPSDKRAPKIRKSQCGLLVFLGTPRDGDGPSSYFLDYFQDKAKRQTTQKFRQALSAALLLLLLLCCSFHGRVRVRMRVRCRSGALAPRSLFFWGDWHEPANQVRSARSLLACLLARYLQSQKFTARSTFWLATRRGMRPKRRVKWSTQSERCA